jgi:hypothetical protein
MLQLATRTIHLNSRHPQLYIFHGSGKRLPTTVSECPGQTMPGQLTGVCHQKKSHPCGQIPIGSITPSLAHKRSVITTLMDRATSTCDKASRASDLQHVKFILEANDYSRQDINRASKPRPTRRSTKKKTNHLAYLPYIQGTIDQICRLLKKHISTRYGNHSTKWYPH